MPILSHGTFSTHTVTVYVHLIHLFLKLGKLRTEGVWRCATGNKQRRKEMFTQIGHHFKIRYVKQLRIKVIIHSLVGNIQDFCQCEFILLSEHMTH